MEQTIQLLELMDRPAFLALDGQIIAANAAALARQIVVGAQIADLMAPAVRPALPRHRLRGGDPASVHPGAGGHRE